MPAKSWRKTSSRFMTRSRKAGNRASPGHPKRARRSSVRWIGFRRRPRPKERQGRVNPKSPARAGAARLGSRPVGRRGRQPGMVKFRQEEPEGQQMEVGQILSRRGAAPAAPLLLRRLRHRSSAQQMEVGQILSRRGAAPAAPLLLHHQSSMQQKQIGKTSCLRRSVSSAIVRPRHLSVTGEIEACRLPRCRGRNKAEGPPIASWPAQHRRELSPQGRHGRDRQSRRLERHQRSACTPLHRGSPAVPRRPERRASLPALVQMTQTTPTSRQST